MAGELPIFGRKGSACDSSPEVARSLMADSAPEASILSPNVESAKPLGLKDEESDFIAGKVIPDSNPPTALPLRPRPVRQCRVDNPPHYKV